MGNRESSLETRPNTFLDHLRKSLLSLSSMATINTCYFSSIFEPRFPPINTSMGRTKYREFYDDFETNFTQKKYSFYPSISPPWIPQNPLPSYIPSHHIQPKTHHHSHTALPPTTLWSSYHSESPSTDFILSNFFFIIQVYCKEKEQEKCYSFSP